MKEVKTLVISGGPDLAVVAKKYDVEATKSVQNGWELFGNRQIVEEKIIKLKNR